MSDAPVPSAANSVPPTDPVLSSEATAQAKPAPPGKMALCLSGGGYRAMLFHLGTLWRLNEAGLLPHLDMVSSVSGGSVTAGVLGLHWNELAFAPTTGVAVNFDKVIAEPILRMANTNIFRLDNALVSILYFIYGFLNKGYVASAYRTHLFGHKTLQDLPDSPRFVINATSVQSGVRWRFEKPKLGDYRVGYIPFPKEELAVAVAASSAFPIFLPPLTLKLDPGAFEPHSGKDLQSPPYTERAILVDGGVYDNLGLEEPEHHCQIILVSDGSGIAGPKPGPYGRNPIRMTEIIFGQDSSLRKRELIEDYENGERSGAYWGITTNIADYKLTETLPCPLKQTTELANTATIMQKMETLRVQRLINWGYAVCDAGLRAYNMPQVLQQNYQVTVPPAKAFPYPDAKV